MKTLNEIQRAHDLLTEAISGKKVTIPETDLAVMKCCAAALCWVLNDEHPAAVGVTDLLKDVYDILK